MVKPWDETMKQLIDASPQHFIDWLIGTGTFLQFVPTELLQPLQQEEPLRADRCLALEIEGLPALLHLEVQSGPDPRLAERLLRYNIQITQNDPLQRPVYTWVIYLRAVSKPPAPPLVRTFPTGQELLRFHYGSLQLAQVEAQALLELDLPGLLPLLPLTRGGRAHQMVLTMFDQLQPSGRTDLMALGAIFTSLVYGQRNRTEQAWLERVIQDMYDIIEQTPLYQSWTRKARQEGLEEGLAKGLKEGKLEGMRQTLVTIVRARFPRLVSQAKRRAAQIDDLEVLDGLISKVSTAQQAKEVRRYLQPPEEGKPDQPH